MRRSIVQWFGLMPEPFASQAIKNTPKHRHGNETSTMSGALMMGFMWGKTEQGFQYWDDLHRKIQLGKVESNSNQVI